MPENCWEKVHGIMFLRISFCCRCLNWRLNQAFWSLQPFGQDYGRASHATFVVWVNFIYEWREKLTSNDRFLRNFFIADFILLSGVFARKLLRGNRWRNIFVHISFWCLSWDGKPGFTSNKPTHYVLEYGDFWWFQHLNLLKYQIV